MNFRKIREGTCIGKNKTDVYFVAYRINGRKKPVNSCTFEDVSVMHNIIYFLLCM